MSGPPRYLRSNCWDSPDVVIRGTILVSITPSPQDRADTAARLRSFGELRGAVGVGLPYTGEPG